MKRNLTNLGLIMLIMSLLASLAFQGCGQGSVVAYKNSYWAEVDPARYGGGGP